MSVAARAVSLARVAYFQVVSEHSGYVIVPRTCAGGRRRPDRCSRRASPPIPTRAPRLAWSWRAALEFRSAGLAVRLAPADESAAADVAESLGARVG